MLGSGEIGLIDGRIGIGAPEAGVACHVALLFAGGLCFPLLFSACVVTFASVCANGTAGALSRAMRDLLNHEGFEVRVGSASFDRKLRSECFLPSRRDELFGLNGSTASAKNS